jgi:2-polyprenyl-3-methyl-5-hydroxy-6-metoxy-1,4-benzoquinol methylase
MRKNPFFSYLRDLFAPIVKLVDRVIFEPVRYGRNKHYNAEKYWHDRFKKFGMTLQASANRQLTEQENEVFYRATTQSFLSVLERESIELSECRVLDIGCGTGYYTRFCQQQGVRDYTGLDITDILFGELHRSFPGYRFIKQDVTRLSIEDQYDCIIMFDVIEHITELSDLKKAMSGILTLLSDGGVFILAPLMDKALQKLSYVRYWTRDEIEPLLTGYAMSTTMPFPDGTIVAIRK